MITETEIDLRLLAAVREAMGEPQTPEETVQETVARTVQDAYLATSQLYKLRLDPKTAALVAKEEGEIWAIQARVVSLLNDIRGEHAAH